MKGAYNIDDSNIRSRLTRAFRIATIVLSLALTVFYFSYPATTPGKELAKNAAPEQSIMILQDLPADNDEVRVLEESELLKPPEEDKPVVTEHEVVEEDKPVVTEHVVVEGDTLSKISEMHATDEETLVYINNLSNRDSLQVGQELAILPIKGVIHEVVRGDTLWDLVQLYDVDDEEGIREVNEISGDTLRIGQELVIPGGQPPENTAVIASTSGQRTESTSSQPETTDPGSKLSFAWPVSGTITSYFGWRQHPVYGTRDFHQGIDIATSQGTSIGASAAGTVVFSGWQGGYGNTVRIEHADGTITRYSHNLRNLVTPGESVTQGQTVAEVGQSGVATGAHVDFGIYINGQPVDPLNYLP